MLKKGKTKQKTKYKNVYTRNKGITLIALVITIIVLLILAGVSINILIGENGLLTKAQDAVKENAKAGAKDKVSVEVFASYDNDGKLNAKTLKDNFEARGWEVTG